MFPRAPFRCRGVLFRVLSSTRVVERSILRTKLLRHLNSISHLGQDLRAKKEKRLEEISARMKSQRLEAEERKRQKEIKFTDRLPPAKRARGCTFYIPKVKKIVGRFTSVCQGFPHPSRRVCSRKRAVKPQRYRGLCSSRVCDPPCQLPKPIANASGMLFQNCLLRPSQPPAVE